MRELRVVSHVMLHICLHQENIVYPNEQISEKRQKKVNKPNFPLHTYTKMANENTKNQRG